MKHYKLLNLKRQHQGTFVVTQEGWNQIQNTKSVFKDIKNFGECTPSGELITDIAANNFTKTVETNGNQPKPRAAKTKGAAENKGTGLDIDIDSDEGIAAENIAK